VELSEIVEESGVDMTKYGQIADVGHFFGRKGNVFKEVEGLFETSGDKIVAIVWQMTHEEFEGSASVKLILDVARRHRQFIKICEKAGEESAREHVLPQFMPVSDHTLL